MCLYDFILVHCTDIIINSIICYNSSTIVVTIYSTFDTLQL